MGATVVGVVVLFLVVGVAVVGDKLLAFRVVDETAVNGGAGVVEMLLSENALRHKQIARTNESPSFFIPAG